MLERFQILCIACLVFDSIFFLIYTNSALDSSASSSEGSDACTGDGYTWSNVMATCTSLKALVALWGCFVHGAVACTTASVPMTGLKLRSITRYGHILVIWNFIVAVLEAVAVRQAPAQCLGGASTVDFATNSTFLQEICFTILWLSWICSAVASAMIGRRVSPSVLEAPSPPSERAGLSGTEPLPSAVGIPVQEFIGEGGQQQGEECPRGGMTQVSGVPLSGRGLPMHSGHFDQQHSMSMSGSMVAMGTPVNGAPTQGMGKQV